MNTKKIAFILLLSLATPTHPMPTYLKKFYGFCTIIAVILAGESFTATEVKQTKIYPLNQNHWTPIANRTVQPDEYMKVIPQGELHDSRCYQDSPFMCSICEECIFKKDTDPDTCKWKKIVRCKHLNPGAVSSFLAYLTDTEIEQRQNEIIEYLDIMENN